jgi:hypothetical protein
MVEFILHVLAFFTKKKTKPLASGTPNFTELASSWNDVETLTQWVNGIFDNNDKLVECISIDEAESLRAAFGATERNWHLESLAFSILSLLKKQGVKPLVDNNNING